MSNCCDDKSCELDALRAKQTSMLKAVLAIDATMFVAELTAGLVAGSISCSLIPSTCLGTRWCTA